MHIYIYIQNNIINNNINDNNINNSKNNENNTNNSNNKVLAPCSQVQLLAFTWRNWNKQKNGQKARNWRLQTNFPGRMSSVINVDDECCQQSS